MKLEALTRQAVRSFSVPYGSSGDLPAELMQHLRHTGLKQLSSPALLTGHTPIASISIVSVSELKMIRASFLRLRSCPKISFD